MPINPITLDKLEPQVIKQMEHKIVDRIVHEIKGSTLANEDKNRNPNFSKEHQEKAAEKFSYFLSKFNIKLEYKVFKDKVRVKLKDKNNQTILESEVEDVDTLLKNVSRETGKIIDLKG